MLTSGLIATSHSHSPPTVSSLQGILIHSYLFNNIQASVVIFDEADSWVEVGGGATKKNKLWQCVVISSRPPLTWGVRARSQAASYRAMYMLRSVPLPLPTSDPHQRPHPRARPTLTLDANPLTMLQSQGHVRSWSHPCDFRARSGGTGAVCCLHDQSTGHGHFTLWSFMCVAPTLP